MTNRLSEIEARLPKEEWSLAIKERAGKLPRFGIRAQFTERWAGLVAILRIQAGLDNKPMLIAAKQCGEFIANAPADIRYLLDENQRLREALDEIRNSCSDDEVRRTAREALEGK